VHFFLQKKAKKSKRDVTQRFRTDTLPVVLEITPDPRYSVLALYPMDGFRCPTAQGKPATKPATGNRQPFPRLGASMRTQACAFFPEKKATKSKRNVSQRFRTDTLPVVLEIISDPRYSVLALYPMDGFRCPTAQGKPATKPATGNRQPFFLS